MSEARDLEPEPKPETNIEDEVLIELQGLEAHRRAYQAEHPSAQLVREDPDVRRLIEAMAFFSVRTRQVAARGVQAVWRRLFGSFFDYLMTPLPTMAMAQAQVTQRLVEAVDLPRGTELRLTTEEGRAGLFTTQADLRVLPLLSEGVQLYQSERGTRLVLPLRARFPRAEAPGVVRVLVSCPESYAASLRLWYGLRVHARRAVVVYDEVADASTEGAPCPLRFGGAADPEEAHAVATDDPGLLRGSEHPLALLRAFFHFPEEGLFLHFNAPPSPRPYTRISLCLDLAPEWVRDPALGPQVLQPFCVPIANLSAAAARPLRCDGVTTRFAIRHPDGASGFELHSVRGVYRATPEGLRPILPAALTHGRADESYELEEDRPGAPRILLRLPRALLAPATVAVDALWHQPRFAQGALSRVSIGLQHRRLDGVEWTLRSGDLGLPARSPLLDDGASLLPLLALRMKPTLGKDELLQVLDVLLPPDRPGPFRRLLPRLRALRVSVRPDGALRGSGLQHAYEAAIDPVEGAGPADRDGDGEDEALLWVFLRRVRELLDVWNADAAVTLRADLGGRELALPL